jgi:hypothetical protein
MVTAQVWTTSKFENSEHIKDPGSDPNIVNPSERAIHEELDRAASLQITREGSSVMRSLQRLVMPLR